MPLALIVGAGIGGLAAGVALQRAGWDIRILERDPAPRPVGFALGLAPNAIAALRELGVGERIAKQGFMPRVGEIRHVDGRVIRRLASTAADAATATDTTSLILRPLLHQALIAQLGPAAPEVDHAVVGFERGADGVRLRTADGRTVEGDLVVGADGVASVIRAQLHPGEPAAGPSGYVAVRGLSPAVDRLHPLEAIWYFGRGVECGIVQAAPDAIYWFVSLLSRDVPSGERNPQAILQRCTRGFDPQLQAIVRATPATDVRFDELLMRAPLARWGEGRVTLLGDAAHPMLPHTGQGAAQALEDAVALGRALRRTADPVEGLRRYEQVRSRRTRRVVQMGPRIARVTTTANPVMGLLRNGLIRWVPQAAIVRAFTQQGPDPHAELERT